MNYRSPVPDLCCDSGKSGRSHALKVAYNIIGKFGDKPWNLWIIKLKLGWYGRASASGEIFGKYDTCDNKLQGGGCGKARLEVGLIGEVVIGVKWRNLNGGGGARGGVGAEGTFCLVKTAGNKGFVSKGRMCADIKAMVWASAGTRQYRYSVNRPWCSDWHYF